MSANKLCSNLLPVGGECSFASEAEVAHYFAQKGLFGNIELVLAINETSDSEDDDIYAWLLTNDNGDILGIISLFETTIDQLSKITFYEKIARGEIFKHKHKSYQVTWNKLLGITVREISDMLYQTDIENVLHQMGFKDLSIYLCKIYPILGPKKLIAYCWKVYAPDKEDEDIDNIFYYPIFNSDAKKIHQWNLNDVNTVTIDVGERITTAEQTWRVYKDKNGKLYIKPFVLNFIKKASQ